MNMRKPHNALAKKAFIPPMIRKVLLASAIHSLMITGASANTLDEFVSYSNNYCWAHDGARYGCQCVELFHRYLQDVFNIPYKNQEQSGLHNNAYPIYLSVLNRGGVTLASALGKKVTFSAIPKTSTNYPKSGDIIFGDKAKLSDGTIAGHVAIVLSADANTFTSLDQNWKNASENYGSAAAKITHNYTDMGVVGWLRANPPTVNLNAPADGLAYNASTSNVTLSWATSSDATTSRVVVSTDQNFSGYSEETKKCDNPTTCTTWAGPSSSYNFTDAKPGQTYYWKVRSNNSDFNLLSDWTAPRKFSITYVISNTTPEATKAEGILSCLEEKFPNYFPPNGVTKPVQQGASFSYVRSYPNKSSQIVFKNRWYYKLNGGRLYLWGSIDNLNNKYCHLSWQ